MLSDLIVVAWADSTHQGGFLPTLRKQLDRAGLDFRLETLEPFSWNRLVRAELEFCLKNPGKRIVGVDTEDFLFLGTARELDDIVPVDDILYHGEARCWPEPHLVDFYPEPYGPYRFVNGTCPCGSTDVLAETIRWGLATHPIRGDESSIFASNDQEFFTHTFLGGFGHVEQMGRLSVQLNAIKPIDTRFESNRLILADGTKPIFVHANGASRGLYADELEKLR